MGRGLGTKLLLLTFASLLIVSFQNCGGSFQAVSGSSQSSSGQQPDPSTPPQQKRFVTVGVGVGGRLVSGINGFESILHDREIFSSALQATMVVDPNDASKVTCPAGWSQVEMMCCFENANQCTFGDWGWHSDFLLRGVAYGQGKFVAVGGHRFGISQVSTDGVRWSEKFDQVTSNRYVTGATTSTGWLAGVAFGKGRFVAVEGYSGNLLWSTDGKNWISTGQVPVPRKTFRRIYFVGNRFYAAGDDNAWGFSDDGLSWSATGNGIAPTEVYQVGSEIYGFVGDTVYKLPSLVSTTWQSVYQHPATIGSFAYHAELKKFFIFVGNRAFSSIDATPGSWQSTTVATPGRWVHVGGSYFVGGGTSYSPDGLSWRTTASPTGASWVIQGYASGLVDY